MLKPRSFDAHKNTIASMIVMLGYSELDTVILDIGMETIDSNDCREVSRDNRNVNSVLVTM